MNLEDFEATEREAQSAKRPCHVVGKTALTIHTPGGHYLYVADPISGEVERRRLPFDSHFSPCDAHLGAVDA